MEASESFSGRLGDNMSFSLIMAIATLGLVCSKVLTTTWKKEVDESVRTGSSLLCLRHRVPTLFPPPSQVSWTSSCKNITGESSNPFPSDKSLRCFRKSFDEFAEKKSNT